MSVERAYTRPSRVGAAADGETPRVPGLLTRDEERAARQLHAAGWEPTDLTRL